MRYYIYENWQAEKKAKVHKSSCSHCQNGNGTHNSKTDVNGKWHGPYNTFIVALNKANSLGDRTVSSCQHCKPESGL